MGVTWQQVDRETITRNTITGLLCFAVIACVLCAVGGVLIGIGFF